jgi:hypothetical protein
MPAMEGVNDWTLVARWCAIGRRELEDSSICTNVGIDKIESVLGNGGVDCLVNPNLRAPSGEISITEGLVDVLVRLMSITCVSMTLGKGVLPILLILLPFSLRVSSGMSNSSRLAFVTLPFQWEHQSL